MPLRIEIIYRILHALGEKNIMNLSELIEHTRVSWPTLYKYLQILEEKGLIIKRKLGITVVITITKEGRELLEKLEEIYKILDKTS